MLLAQGALSLAEEHGMIGTQLRARMNLSDLHIALDPKRGFDIASVGVDLAEKVGHPSWAAALAGNEGFAAILLGQWRRPIERAGQLDRSFITGYGRFTLLSMAAISAAFLGEPAPEAWQPETIAEGVSQGGSMLLAFRAIHGVASGVLDDVDRLAVASAEGGSSHFGESAVAACLATNAMIWLRERDRLAAMIDYLETYPWSGIVKGTTLRQARAALAALDGTDDGAVGAYRDALETWRRLGLRPHIGVTQMEMLQLFGDALPDREAIEADARATLEELQAVTLLARFEGVVEGRALGAAS
jgi:hypothetical protein